MPKYGTIQRAICYLDEAAFSAIVSRWGEEVMQTTGEKLQGVAVDGKYLRGTRLDDLPAIQVLSAVGHKMPLVLGQEQVPEGTNEIKAIMTLLSQLVLEGRVVTVDALLTQREIAEAIWQKGGTT